jgi:hypothetical protein
LDKVISEIVKPQKMVFCWNALLSGFEEGDAKGFAEIRTGDLQIQKLALYP